MRSSRLFILMVLGLLAYGALHAADDVASGAPPLPDMTGLQAPPDMTLPGLELPEIPGITAAATPTAPAATVPAAAPAVAPAAEPAAAAPVVATPTPVPAALAVEATSVPTEVPTAIPSPVSTPEAAPAAAASAETVPVAEAKVVLKGLEAYFPMQPGMKWEYRSSMAQVRTVECISRDAKPTGVSGVFQVTMGGTTLGQTWKRAGGKITLASKLSSLPVGWVRLVEPQGKTVPRWLFDRGNGTASYYKQEAGPVTAAGKKYEDGLTVTERTLTAGKQVSLRKWFYAKGVGLVAEAAYNLKGEPLADQTFELQPAQ